MSTATVFGNWGNYNKNAIIMQMMRIIAGGKASRAWVAESCQEYVKRLRKPYQIEWQFVDEADLTAKVLALPKQDFVVLLDERGTIMDSVDFAKMLERNLLDGRNIVFVLGGAFGHFSESLHERANFVLSFSKMVFPHQLCRVILAEQIYRAQEIIEGRPYHHA